MVLLRRLRLIRYGYRRRLLYLRGLQRRGRAGRAGFDLPCGSQGACPRPLWREQTGDIPADGIDTKGVFLTGVSRHVRSDLGAEIDGDERRREESYGGGGKSPPAACPSLLDRSLVFSPEISIARYRIPVRRRDSGRLAVFAEPFTHLGRPVTDVIGPARFILEDDRCSVPR